MARHHTTPKNDVPTAVSSQHTAADIDSADAPNTQNFNKKQYPTTDPASIWVVVNKQHPLNPKAYTPANLVVPDIPLRSNITSTEKYVRADMAKALEHMVNDAANQGVHFNLQSGYRSYAFQVTLYNGYVKSQGQSVADRQSARPGFSEHQTGLAADLGGTSQPACNVEACYSDTVEGKWLVAHSYQYGFIIRYPSDKEPVTGYLYEPWHIRYIGTELSQKLHADGIETLEEFFGVTGGTSY
jgi:D-alanyl-D-alanine carboxypeptidase